MDSNKCGECSKKLTIVSKFSCKCDNNYCAIHRMPENHQCSHINIFKQNGIDKLQKQLIKVVNQKVPIC
jgi:predicted nucleic acid binding AN1-type Zn finger protein